MVVVVVVVVVVVERLLPLRRVGLVLERLKLNLVLLPVPPAVLEASVWRGSRGSYTGNLRNLKS